MELFTVGKQTYVYLHNGDKITGNLIELDPIGVTLDKADRETERKFRKERRKIILSLRIIRNQLFLYFQNI